MRRLFVTAVIAAFMPVPGHADKLEVIADVEGQPLGQNAVRLVQALDFLGTPLTAPQREAIAKAAMDKDARQLQELLDPYVLLAVTINPEARVKVARGPAAATIQQHGFTPVLVKVVNDSTVKSPLRIGSPQSGPRQMVKYPERPRPKENDSIKERFLQVEMFTGRPMTDSLSGLKVEYAVALIYSNESGKREATIHFDVGQGTQDLGFRGEVPVLFEIQPAVEVKLSVTDFDNEPTVGRFTFRDRQGRVYPARPKRLAPDFFFQDQVYRPDGGTVLLPPGELVMTFGRGPEYRLVERKIVVSPQQNSIAVKLERWINPMDYGFYNGDHHIHAAGCAHYTSPTEGVFAEDMFLHVKGEGLNVGCNLTWGPCFDFQRQFFEPTINKLSEPFCVLKYDLEISGFGSQAMGHVCLLNLKNQDYPGSDGTKTKGWPTWTTPAMRWAKEQGGFTGYAHSANGLNVNAAKATRRLFAALDRGAKGFFTRDDAAKAELPLPEPFANLDANADDKVTEQELAMSHQRTLGRLPNHCIPEMDGIGAQEICVTTAMGVCDFISAMDTARVPEWNCWYQIMNCGFPLKASGETDFPCISGSRVGQGRVYVQMGKIDRIDYPKWCEGLARGRSYISDGYAHALDFRVGGETSGGEIKLDAPGKVKVTAKVAFARDVSLGTAVGAQTPQGNTRKVELVVNGQVADSVVVPADNMPHDLQFEVPMDRSSWVAIRHFPQMHTNPVNVIVEGKPIRASKKSAQWCIGVIEQLWRVRGPGLAPNERPEADRTFKKALDMYRKIASEAYDDTK